MKQRRGHTATEQVFASSARLARVAETTPLTWQPTLLDRPVGGVAHVERIQLDATSWLDHSPGWWSRSDWLFERLREGLRWHAGERTMYERVVAVPRLTAPVTRDSSVWPSISPIVEALSHRYGETLDQVWCNFYRDGTDSVAWHRDRIRHTQRDPLVAIVSVGEPRRLLMRPRGGGPSRRFALGHGDLLVMGGACQHDHEHCVPKVRRAGPRISVTFRSVAG